MGVMFGILTGLVADVLSKPYVYEVQAAPVEVEPRVVQLEVIVNWTPERIEKEIRNVFTEAPNTAVAVAKSESGGVLVKEIRSKNIIHYGQEKSFCTFQIHAPVWDPIAKDLGYADYRTNPASCVRLAHYIYKDAGGFTPWTEYRNGNYKKFL